MENSHTLRFEKLKGYRSTNGDMHQLARPQFPHDPSRVTHYDRVSGDVGDNHTSSPYDGSIADSDTFQDHGSGNHEDVVTDLHIVGVFMGRHAWLRSVGSPVNC